MALSDRQKAARAEIARRELERRNSQVEASEEEPSTPAKSRLSIHNPEKQSIPQILGQNFVRGLKAMPTALAAGANVAALGLPEIAFQKMLGRNFVPFQDDPAMQDAAREGSMLGMVYGAPKMIGGALGALGSKILPKSAGMGISAVRGALVGAGVSGSQLPPPDEAETFEQAVGQMGEQAIEGAKVGAMFGAGLSVLNSGIKAFDPNKVKITPEEVARLKNQKIDVSNKAAMRVVKVEKIKENMIKSTNDNINTLSKELQSKTSTNAPKVKSKVSDFLKSFNEGYGKTVDSIAKSLKGKIPRQDAAKWVDDLVDKYSRNPDFQGTKGLADLKSLSKSLKGSSKSNLVDASGKPIKADAGGTIGFKDLNANIKRTLSGQTFNDQSNINNAIYDDLRQGYGQFLGKFDTSSSFANLQKTSSQVYDFRKFARTMFKPNTGYDTKNLEGLIKKVASGKSTAGERQLLNQAKKVVGSDLDELIAIQRSINNGKTSIKDIAVRARNLSKKIRAQAKTKSGDITKDINEIEAQLPTTKKGLINYVNGIVNLTFKAYVVSQISKMGRGGE